MTGSEHHARCPLCGGGSYTPLPRYARAYLARCRHCSFVFAKQRPGGEELHRHYEGYSRQDYDSPITRRRYAEILLRCAPYRKTNRLLDLGCGVGYFLEEAVGYGWEAHGTEYGARAVEINRAKGLDVVDASSGSMLEAGSFDVITSFEVVEHVRDPRQEATEMARLLRPGGLLYCTTPNFNSLSRRVLRDRWTAIDYPEHLNYFTVSTLSRLFEQAGLRAISVTSSGLSVSRLRGGLCGAGARDPSGSETLDEDLRSRIERSTLLAVAKRTANGILGATRSGDTIKGWFELGPDNQRAV